MFFLAPILQGNSLGNFLVKTVAGETQAYGTLRPRFAIVAALRIERL
jgi:hypothetical protein